VDVRNGAVSVTPIRQRMLRRHCTSYRVCAVRVYNCCERSEQKGFGGRCEKFLSPANPVINKAVTGQGRQILRTMPGLAALAFRPCRALLRTQRFVKWPIFMTPNMGPESVVTNIKIRFAHAHPAPHPKKCQYSIVVAFGVVCAVLACVIRAVN
jgi:hypothetical protein